MYTLGTKVKVRLYGIDAPATIQNGLEALFTGPDIELATDEHK
jgi:endonuclease YncB( thermonuclease family)